MALVYFQKQKLIISQHRQQLNKSHLQIVPVGRIILLILTKDSVILIEMFQLNLIQNGVP